MNVIKPSYEILTDLDADTILKHIERCGRICYKSEWKITDDSAPKFVSFLIAHGHESVLEHYSFSVKFVVDRGVSHEIVRHRIASYSQESTRYCNYGGKGITVIEPSYLDDKTRPVWLTSCLQAEAAYNDMLASGCTPQEARAVLPTSLKTELIMTANLREWRHFLTLRTDRAAHPQIREVAIPLLNELKELLPTVFGDIIVKE